MNLLKFLTNILCTIVIFENVVVSKKFEPNSIVPTSSIIDKNLKYALAKQRAGKVFPIFSVVTFPNSLCTGSDAFNGSCEAALHCFRNGGTISGVCAAGFAACCVYRLSCGATIRANVTYFVNPNYPDFTTDSGSQCSVNIEKVHPEVDQLRLDFDTFSMNGVTNGQCTSDSFRVTGNDVDQTIPIICGLNTGQHIYVNVRNSNGPINLMVTTTGNGNRMWKIRVVQLGRGNSQLAPQECLQYFMDFSGVIKSFNFDSPVPPSGQANYINNLNYAMCIARQSANCQIRFTATSVANSFDLETPDSMSGVDGSCLGDYLLILGSRNAAVNGGTATQAPIGSRFCGVALSTTAASIVSNPIIYSLSGPIQLAFVTNNQTPAASSDRGFSINYQQIPCVSNQKK